MLIARKQVLREAQCPATGLVTNWWVARGDLTEAEADQAAQQWPGWRPGACESRCPSLTRPMDQPMDAPSG